MEGPTSSWGLRNRITLLTLQEHDDDGDDDDEFLQSVFLKIRFFRDVTLCLWVFLDVWNNCCSRSGSPKFLHCLIIEVKAFRYVVKYPPATASNPWVSGPEDEGIVFLRRFGKRTQSHRLVSQDTRIFCWCIMHRYSGITSSWLGLVVCVCVCVCFFFCGTWHPQSALSTGWKTNIV